jgi:hypothetical protein
MGTSQHKLLQEYQQGRQRIVVDGRLFIIVGLQIARRLWSVSLQVA